ncbi:MAG TPA: TolC family protein [Candidatus Wallbacteria bacterium]|nr:TolC family protein [Candidatus Wallbacteria bacterium]
MKIGISSKFSFFLFLSFLLFHNSVAAAASLDEIVAKAVSDSRDMKKIYITLKNGNNDNLLTEIGYRPNFSVSVNNKNAYQYSLSQKVADMVSFSVSRSEDNDTADSQTTSYSLSLDLRRLDNADLRIAKFGYNLDLLMFVNEREKFKFNLIKQFYDLVLALEEYKVLESSCERWKGMLDYSKSKYELGLANKIDYLNSEVNLGNAQNARLLQQQTIEHQKELLMDVIGCDLKNGETGGIELKYDLKFEPLDSSEVSKIAAGGIEGFVREDLEAEKVRLKIAGLKYSKIKKQALPKVKLSLGRVEYKDPAYEDKFTSMLSYNFVLGKQDNQIAEWSEKNNLELRKMSLADLENAVLIEQREILRRLKYLEEAYAIASKSLSQAEENYEFSKLSFQKGMISNIDLRDAQDKLTDAKRTVISLIVQYKVARSRFYYVMGKDL